MLTRGRQEAKRETLKAPPAHHGCGHAAVPFFPSLHPIAILGIWARTHTHALCVSQATGLET